MVPFLVHLTALVWMLAKTYLSLYSSPLIIKSSITVLVFFYCLIIILVLISGLLMFSKIKKKCMFFSLQV